MLGLRLFVTIVLCLMATPAQAAGFRFIEAPAHADGPALSGAVWYPCSEPSAEIDLGKITAAFKITVRGAKDCPISGDKMLLVAVSHGMSGDVTAHHDLAVTLTDAGFVVAAVTHPRDRAPDGSLADGRADFVERPTDIERLIDFMLGISPAASRIDPRRIGFFGFSFGGYPGLVLIGAVPDWETTAGIFCQKSADRTACQKILRAGQRLTNDSRIKGAVIADPPGFLFAGDSFTNVKAPVPLCASEHEIKSAGLTMPSVATVAAVDKNLAANHEYHVVPNSTHFALLFICPPAMAKGVPDLCRNAPDFDRVAFHKNFNAEVLRFFRTDLANR